MVVRLINSWDCTDDVWAKVGADVWALHCSLSKGVCNENISRIPQLPCFPISHLQKWRWRDGDLWVLGGIWVYDNESGAGRHLHNHILCCIFCHYFFTTITLCCKKIVFWIFLARSGVKVNSGQSPQHICIIMSITITPCSCGHDWHHLFHRHYFCHSIVTSHNHHFRHRLLRENAGVQDELHVSRVNRFISGWLWDGMWSVPNIVKEYRLSNI